MTTSNLRTRFANVARDVCKLVPRMSQQFLFAALSQEFANVTCCTYENDEEKGKKGVENLVGSREIYESFDFFFFFSQFSFDK